MTNFAAKDDLRRWIGPYGSAPLAPRDAFVGAVPHRVTLAFEVQEIKKGILVGTGSAYPGQGWVDPAPYYDVLLCSAEPSQLDLPIGEASPGDGQITLRLSAASSLSDYLPGRRFTVTLTPEDAL
jgi:hypothetical protein